MPRRRNSSAVGETMPSVRLAESVPLRALQRLCHAHEVGARILGADRARVAARPDLLEHRLGRLEVGRDEAHDRAVEVARAALVVERGHLDVQLASIAGAEAHVDALGVLRRKRPRHELRGQGPELGRSDPRRRPLLARVARPRDRASEAVLPLREERVLAAGQQRDRGAALGRRGVVAEELGQPAGIEPVEDLGARRWDRLERLLDDLLAGGADRLAQEDVRDRRRVGRVVVATTRLLGQAGGGPGRSAAGADRRERDPGRPHVVQQLVVRAGCRPAVGDEDDVAQGGRVVDEVVVGGLQAGVDVRVAVGAEAEPVADGAEVDRRGADRPVRVLVEGDDAELVGRRERLGGAQDRLLGDVDLLEAALARWVGRVARCRRCSGSRPCCPTCPPPPPSPRPASARGRGPSCTPAASPRAACRGSRRRRSSRARRA